MSQSLNSIASHYHQRTKYAPETIAQKGKALDWANQPVPFKKYQIGQVTDLKPFLSGQTDAINPLYSGNWLRLSLLLLCSYGLTAQVNTIYGEPIYLRAAPSAGGLYPAEIYLVSRGTPWLPAGLYNYQVQTHSLVHFWQDRVWQDLQVACFDNEILKEAEIALVSTAVFYRSAWRYEDRAYRRICLDTGHLLGNIELAAAINSYQTFFLGGFNDAAINKLLYLDAATEGAIAIIPLIDLLGYDSGSELSYYQSLASQIDTNYPTLADGELLGYLHQATTIDTFQPPTKPESAVDSVEDKYNFPFCTKISTANATPIDWGENFAELENTILERRSTRAYSNAAISLQELISLLNFTYQPEDYAEQGLDPSPDYFALELIETFIAVSEVSGLEAGCYYYAPKAQELRQIRFKNFRQELHYLCLGQDLGKNASAVVFHTADLQQAIAKYGDRAYRYLHLDAGHLGQKLNLAAIRLGLGVSGIGGFFDDQVNQVLGIPEAEAVIYLTTLGVPV
ncbi:MAG TPA: SagB/ThcOx family dehydrogenase, partial [Xenococcaceae cyanobacterium]